MDEYRELLHKEVRFKTSRSGGAGGQHVNKVETRVSLIWDLERSTLFATDHKNRLRSKLKHRLNKDGILQLDVSDDRSQLKNKETAIDRFLDLLTDALKEDKKRIATKVPKSKILDRLDRKKKNALKKQQRRKFDID